jgi:Flp pilus assembly protein CpaB
MTYRIRNVVVAIGLALVAMMLTLYYVTNYKRSVQHGESRVQVYVAAHDIQPGASGAELVKSNDLKAVQVTRRSVVPGAISSPSQIETLVLSNPVYAGEQVTLRRFSDVAAQGIRSQLKGTQRAIQVPGDANQLLLGTLHTGDHVDIVASLRVDPDKDTHAVRIVLRDLTVLALPEEPATARVSSSATSSVILAVTDTQVQRLFYVITHSDWTLELRPVVDAADSPERVENLGTVLTAGLR